MAGQSAHLSLKEARAMQERVQHSGSHAKSNGGGSSNLQKDVKMSGGDSVHRKMKKMKEC
jgi:hypothetical protein